MFDNLLAAKTKMYGNTHQFKPSVSSQLLVVPCCGLCNRLQAIICGQLLAEDTGRELFINWEAQGVDCGSCFEDLFSTSFGRLEQIPANASIYSSIQRHIGCATDRYLGVLTSSPKENFNDLKKDKALTMAIFTCHQFLKYFHDKRFPVRLRALIDGVCPAIKDKVAGYQAIYFTGSTIGIHIRRKDWRSQKAMEYYFKNMDKLSKKNKGSSFFVCSDDAESLQAMRERYGNVHYYPTRSLHRGSPEAIEDALIELLLLSKTIFLLGTPGSSFSSMAQVIGGMPSNFQYGLSMSRRDFSLGNVGLGVFFQRIYHRLKLCLQGY